MNLTLSRPRQRPQINNVVVDRHTIPVNVTRYITDVNGAILAITDPLIIAANLNVSYPVFLFGEFDRQGGYYIGNKVCPPRGASVYLTSFVNGQGNTSASIIGFTGFNEIQGRLKHGDIVQVYTDSLQNPNYFVWIVLTHSSASIGSIMTNLKTEQKDNRNGKLFVEGINYYYQNALQLDEALHVSIADNLGTYLDDSIQPNIYKSPMVAQPDLIYLQVNFVLNQFMGLNFYLRPDIDNVSFDFDIVNVS